MFHSNPLDHTERNMDALNPQLALFLAKELSQCVASLEESRRQYEQDDWIGQARELHFKKYGS